MNTTRLSFIKQLGDSDSDAWGKVRQIYEPLILKWLKRFQLQTSDAEDLTQEVMLVLAKQIRQFEHSGNVGAFRKWLRTTTVNLAHNYLRKVGNAPKAVGSDTFQGMLNELADPNSAISREFHLEHDRIVIQRLLDSMRGSVSPSTLDAFRMHVVRGVSAKDTADALGVSIASVHTAKSRVLRRLRSGAADLMDELQFT